LNKRKTKITKRAKKEMVAQEEGSGLKNFLKTLKLNEELISMVLGALVIVIVGILVVNYFKDKKGTTLPTALSTTAPAVAKAEPGKSHTVKSGETLWSIAEDAYGSGYNWTDIYKENKLAKEGVSAGQVLNIPAVAAKEPTSTNKVATIEPSPSVTVVAQTTPVASVSPKASATPIAMVSPMASATVVASTTPSATATLASTGTTATSNATSYTVAKGDSLWKIAVAQYGNGYKWVEIARTNKLVNPNVIHAGNVLTLPR
jgi:nucleoid-associated protein YgaU